MAQPYQLASDGFWGNAYSGVIKADGSWVACAHGSTEWQAYMDWFAADPANRADEWKSPADGGVAIILKQDEVPVGSMFDSLPPEAGATAAAATVAAKEAPKKEEAQHEPHHSRHGR